MNRLKERLETWLETLVGSVVKRAFAHDMMGLAAEGAFRFLLSFVPAWIFLVALTTVVGLDNQSIEYVVTSLTPMLPGGSERVVEETIRAAVENPMPGLLTSSLLLTLWTASGVLGTFTKGLNRAFDCRKTHYTFWRNIVVSMTLVPIIAIPVTFASVLVVFGSSIAHRLAVYGGISFLEGALGWTVRWATTSILVVVMLALLYKVAPAQRLPFRPMLPGAAVAFVIWVLLSNVFKEFVESGFARYRIYGSLTAVVLFMFWAYLSAIAFLVGAEFNAELLARRTVSEADEIEVE